MQLRDSEEAGCDYGYEGEEEFHAISPPLVAYSKIMVSLARIARAALKNIGLTYRTLLMPMNYNGVQW